MFFFAKGVRELLVTSGVAISCCLLVVLAIHGFASGVWGSVFGLFPLVLVVAVLGGNKIGYLATRYIWSFVAFLALFGCLLNPIAWSDSLTEGFWMIGSSLLISPSAFCLSYCLSEHAKLRQLDGAQRWRSFPLSARLVLFLLGAGVAGFVGLWLLVSVGTRIISKQMRTAADIHSLKAQLGDYQKHKDVYPTTEQGLQTLGLVPKDPWSNDYVYRYPGKRYPNAYDLFSAGPDRTADTADDEWGQ